MGSVFSCTKADAKDNCSDPTVVYEEGFIWYFLPILMLIYVPLVWIRNMEKLAFTHIISDVLIIVVIFGIFGFGAKNIVDNDGDVTLNPLFTISFF